MGQKCREGRGCKGSRCHPKPGKTNPDRLFLPVLAERKLDQTAQGRAGPAEWGDEGFRHGETTRLFGG